VTRPILHKPQRGPVPVTRPPHSTRTFAGVGVLSYLPIYACARAGEPRLRFACAATRRGILERLAGGPATIGELAEPFGLTLNGVRKHVGILEEVDLVVTAKVGRARECPRSARAQRQELRAGIRE